MRRKWVKIWSDDQMNKLFFFQHSEMDFFFHFIMNHWKVRIEEYWSTDHLERDKHKAESLQFICFVIDVCDSWIASHSMNLDPVSMQTLRNSKAQFSF